MRIRIRWQRSRDSGQERKPSLSGVLAAAGQTAYYRRLGLTAEGAGRIEEFLDRFPRIDGALRARRRQAFHNPRAAKPGLKRLLSPVHPVPRTAVFLGGIAGGIVESAAVRIFRPDQAGLLGRFGPEAIAAPANLLIELARLAESREIFVPRLQRYLIVFTEVGDQPLDDAGRDLLWRVFRVPLYEQLLGTDGAVFAAECEAHEGIHLQPNQAIVEREPGGELLLTSLTDLRFPAIRVATGWTASLDRALCACGQPHARLIGLKGMPAPSRAFAAPA